MTGGLLLRLLGNTLRSHRSRAIFIVVRRNGRIMAAFFIYLREVASAYLLYNIWLSVPLTWVVFQPPNWSRVYRLLSDRKPIRPISYFSFSLTLFRQRPSINPNSSLHFHSLNEIQLHWLCGTGILLAAICLLIPANSATYQAFQPVRGETKKKRTQYENLYAQLSSFPCYSSIREYWTICDQFTNCFAPIHSK